MSQPLAVNRSTTVLPPNFPEDQASNQTMPDGSAMTPEVEQALAVLTAAGILPAGFGGADLTLPTAPTAPAASPGTGQGDASLQDPFAAPADVAGQQDAAGPNGTDANANATLDSLDGGSGMDANGNPVTTAPGQADPLATANPADSSSGTTGDDGSATAAPTSTTLADNSTLQTWSSGTTRRTFKSGVTVDHSSTASDPVNPSADGSGGQTVITLADKTTIRTDGSADGADPFATAYGTGTPAPKPTGALITVQPDGTQIRATANGVQITRPGSSTPETVGRGKSAKVGDYTIAVSKDGSSSVKGKDGTTVATDANGVSTTTLGKGGPEVAANGNVTTSSADHAQETLGPDGTPVSTSTGTTSADGSTTEVSTDGSSRRTLPGGVAVKATPSDNNRVTATLGDGVVVDTVDAAADDSGAMQGDPMLTPDASQPAANASPRTRDTSVTLADGTKVKFTQNGVSYTDLNGRTDSVIAGAKKKTIPGADGVSVSMSGAGYATLTFPDGRKIVVDPTGTPNTTIPGAGSDSVSISGDGTTKVIKGGLGTVYDAQGNAVGSSTIKQGNGSVTETFSNGLVQNTSTGPGGDTVISNNSDEGVTDVRGPSGSEVWMGTGALKAVLPNGCMLADTQAGFSYTTPSGVTVVIERGAATKKLSDGTTVEFTKDGELNVNMSDGMKMHVDTEKTVTTTLPDGRIVNQNGTVTTKGDKGSQVMSLDGSVVDTSTISAPDANGVTTESWSTDPTRIYRVQGTDIKVEHDPTNKTSISTIPGATVYTSDDGSSFHTALPDGSSIVYTGGMWQHVLADGTTATEIKKDDDPVTVGDMGYDMDGDGNMHVTGQGFSIDTDTDHHTVINGANYTIDNSGWYQPKK